eukprot:scaffold12158_cov17-Tisochrysis_lutea.AAC.1
MDDSRHGSQQVGMGHRYGSQQAWVTAGMDHSRHERHGAFSQDAWRGMTAGTGKTSLFEHAGKCIPSVSGNGSPKEMVSTDGERKLPEPAS